MKNAVEIARLRPGDLKRFVELIRLFEDVFEMENFRLPANDHLQKLLAKDDFFVFVAILDHQVVGGLTAYTLEQYYSVRPLAYLYDLAVDARFQRMGIGGQLIAALNEFCTQKGFEEVFVQADKIDEYAIDFYRSTRPTEEEQVVHFYYTLDRR